jgi:hypothetical protein
MNKEFKINDKIIFSESAVEDVRGKTGIINKFLGVTHISLAKLEQGKSVNYGLYKDVNMWEIKLDNSNELYRSPEGWLEKID